MLAIVCNRVQVDLREHQAVLGELERAKQLLGTHQQEAAQRNADHEQLLLQVADLNAKVRLEMRNC